MFYRIINFILLLNLTACAWKGPGPTGANTGNSDQSKLASDSSGSRESAVPKSVPPVQIDFSIQWQSLTKDGGVQKLVRSISEKNDVSKEFYLDRPITLPATVPDEVELDFNVGKLNLRLDETILISGKVDSSDLSLKNNPLIITPDHAEIESSGEEKHLKVRISGIRHVLSDSEQQKAFINLDFRYSKTTLKAASAYFSLITPPKKVFFEQKELGEAPVIHGLDALDFETLQSPALKLELVKVIQAQNKTGENIVIDAPAKIGGKLWQKRRWYFPQHAMKNGMLIDHELCVESAVEYNRDYVFADGFYVLPLTSELKTNWISILTDNRSEISVPSLQDRLYGVFAVNSGTKASLKASLSESRLSEYYSHNLRWKPEMVTINTQCKFGCASASTYPRFFSQCEDIPPGRADWQAQCQERVAACEPCVKLRALGSFETVWGDACNRCHALEANEGINQIFDYHGVRACTDWVTKVKETKQAVFGEVVEEPELELDPAGIQALVRFGYSSKVEDPEGRGFDLIKLLKVL